MELAGTRRQFMQTLAGASLSALSVVAREPLEDLDTFKRIPSSLPHLDSIRVYPVTNSQHILVHVRQSHESNQYEVLFGGRGAVSRRTVECQTAIRSGIGKFLQTLPCDALYIEGLKLAEVEIMRSSVNGFRDVTQEQERVQRRAQKAKLAYESKNLSSPTTLEVVKSLEASVARFDTVIKNTITTLDRESISHSTAIQLAAAHNLAPESPNTPSVERFLERFSRPYDQLAALNSRVAGMERRASEISIAYLKGATDSVEAREELRKLQVELESAIETKRTLTAEIERQFRSEQDNIFTAREEAIISLIAARPRSLTRIDTSLILLGAKHDLLPEVTAHNAKYRDNKISLVVVTPAGLADTPER